VLILGDLVSNIHEFTVVRVHKERNKDAIMDVKESGVRHRTTFILSFSFWLRDYNLSCSRARGESSVLVLDSKTSE
jgi:hypothetical protein